MWEAAFVIYHLRKHPFLRDGKIIDAFIVSEFYLDPHRSGKCFSGHDLGDMIEQRNARCTPQDI